MPTVSRLGWGWQTRTRCPTYPSPDDGRVGSLGTGHAQLFGGVEC